jgi:hypothetical protein
VILQSISEQAEGLLITEKLRGAGQHREASSSHPNKNSVPYSSVTESRPRSAERSEGSLDAVEVALTIKYGEDGAV